MQINLNGQSFHIGQDTTELTAAERKVVQIIQDWQQREKTFFFQTSGSTGASKQIEISRATIEYSATCALDKLDPNRSFASSLICINPNFIGGFMAVIRGLIGGHHLTFVDPGSNPLASYPDKSFDLVSMVPLQVETILNESPELMRNVNTVIIGGAGLNDHTLRLIKQSDSTQFYHSYGMTETASHFALRNLKTDKGFEVLGDAKLSLNDYGCLSVKGTCTAGEQVQTTDLVQISDDKHFVWLGRADHIINSGGVKVNPIEVEKVLDEQVGHPFFVAGLPDETLGEKVVMIIESQNSEELRNFDFSKLPRYHRPKQVFALQRFVYTETEKINRKETIKLLKIES